MKQKPAEHQIKPLAEADTSWHSMQDEAVFTALDVNADGLANDEVQRRFDVYGANRLPESNSHGLLYRFFYQFHNVLIYVLIAAGIVVALLEHWVDAGVILGVVIINALIGFVQEGKAENALKAIRQMLSPKAVVLRDAQRHTIASEELVPGDIVLVQSGDKIPADLRLFTVKSLQIQEAVLTGESVAVEKRTVPVADDAELGDRHCMAYSGTLVTYGQGRGVVVATGAGTEIGQISAMLAEVETLTTPLLRQISQFARWLTLIIGIFALATFAFGIGFRDYPAADMFLAAVGLAVAAIPEGLPAIMTITLSIGVQRMAHRHAIIRRLPAVETLGSVTVICSDKTGTLTRNEMTVQSVTTANEIIEVTGVGYNPHGAFLCEGQEITVDDHPILAELMRASILCNDASLLENTTMDSKSMDSKSMNSKSMDSKSMNSKSMDGKSEWLMQGDPTEGALLALGIKAGLEAKFEQEKWPRSDVIPFESEHRFMATLHHGHTGEGFVYIKGAPERLLEVCTLQRSYDGDVPIDSQYWHTQILAMARFGQRVLAIALKSVTQDQHELNFADLETGLTLIGIVGIIDPPREEVSTAIHKCQSAGIQVKMITGDHAITAVAIGAQMGIGDGEKVLIGHEIETMDDAALRALVDDIDIFARSTPEHKLRLVKAMQANGDVVAMTGDGVNDAPALKRADVGTAMGQNGTEVAKESAEVVLADDNFASIAFAVEEGRTVYDNLKKAILFILPTNGGEALIIIAAIVFGTMLPITPVQILWVNMITAVTLALALAFEPAEANIMQRPPRDSHEPLLTGMFIWRIAFVSLILLAGTFGLFLWEREQGGSIELARTVAVNTLVMFEIFYLFNSRYITANVLNVNGLLGNTYALMAIGILIIFQLLFTYLVPMQALFGTTSIGINAWVRIVLVASSVLFLVEFEKYVIRQRSRTPPNA